jgi:uncharacterized oligopeptide transporter (OPT) family protein
MGFPVTLSMNAGMLVGWGVLSPLAKNLGWAPGPVSSTTDGSRGWIVRSEGFVEVMSGSYQLWVALAIMIAESIISLLPITLSYTARILAHRRQRSSGPRVFRAESPRNSNVTEDDYYDPSDDNDDSDPEHEPPHRLVPMSWVRWGLGGSAALGVGLVWYVFGSDGIHPWATAVGLVLASVLSLIGVRALGETDINPVSDSGLLRMGA